MVSEAAVSAHDIPTGFWRDRRGTVAVAVAVLLPVLIGFAGIGVEIGLWFSVQRQNQSAADAAAISAALEYAAQIESGVTTNPTAAAITTANYNLFSTSSPNTLTLYPCYGLPIGSSCNTSTSNGAPNAVQVVLTQPLNTTFANIVTAIWGPSVNTVTITTTAIAAFPQTSSACLLALDPTGQNALLLSDNATLPNLNCGVASNSSAANALSLGNNATIDGPVSVVGDWSLANNAALNGSPNLRGAPAIPDPYRNLVLPPLSACTNNVTVPLRPGHFCAFPNTAEVTLSPGTYYFDTLTINDNATVNGEGGVTIVVKYPINIGKNVPINITAPGPTSGEPFPGIAIMDLSPITAVIPATQIFPNTTTMNIKGAIYFRYQIIEFDNNVSSPAGCIQIIGRIIQLNSNLYINDNCSGVGTTPIWIIPVFLTQ